MISNPELAEEKKEKIKKDGEKELHILTDFDRTLTYAFHNNDKLPTLIAQLRNGSYLSEKYAKKSYELFDEYHPIEISATIPTEKKIEKMKEWWIQHFKLLAKSGLDKQTLEKATSDIVIENKIRLRNGAEEFLKIMNKENIPVVIMSSSVGNIIRGYLKRKNLLFDNIHIISNFLEFDDNGKFKGIEDNKIVHVFNKSEIQTESLSVYDELEKRRNVILMGDSLGDLGMIQEFKYKNLISIGFLNEKIQESLPVYKNKFDVVLTNDADFTYVSQLVNEIIN